MNTLTLLAMVLAIGLVVDDSIVVLENIYRHLESGMSRLDAALMGAREIAFAVIAMTVTLAAVYAPLAFATGRTGRLFIEFALALAGAVLVSGFVALTLSPMMCSKLLKHEPSTARCTTSSSAASSASPPATGARSARAAPPHVRGRRRGPGRPDVLFLFGRCARSSRRPRTAA